MCCFFGSLALIGPRFAILVWWIIDQNRWNEAFDNLFIPFIGWLLVPWTTMSYVLVFPGGVNGFDWVILGLGIFADVASWSSGGISGRRYQTTV